MKAFYLSLIFILTLFVFLFPIKVFALEQIRNFDVEIVVHQDGTFNVIELISYDFGTEQRHGVYRNIPLVSAVGNLYRVIGVDFQKILRDGMPESYSLNQDSNQISVKIGKADVEITGSHTYTISYLVKNGIGSNYEDHDEIFWNITGNSWQVPINKTSVNLKTDFGVSPNKALCFTGVSGSKEQNCDFSQISTVTANNLGPSEGLTAVWNFPKNTFPPSTLTTQKPSGVTNHVISTGLIIGIFVIPILLNLVLAPILLIWYFKNKRKERFGPPSVNFDLPEDNFKKRVAPAQAGSIDIYRVDQNDVIATIFDLAIRKYLKIEQVKKGKVLGVFGKDEDYKFTKLKEADQKITGFEQVIFDRLFEEGKSIELSSLKKDFYQTFDKFEKKVFQSLIDRSFYIKNPKNQMGLLLAGGILFLFSGGLILGSVLIYLSRKLNGRTALGDEMDWKIDGLKIFLKNMERYYTFQAKNLYTVEKYIPYAIAFGVIKEFMEQLKVIYPDYHPTWYSGNLAFYAVTSNMFSSMSSSFTTHAPSSSSGFSGGGSSGGGGGGGGGGSW